ncbi:NAD(P)H-binding protein [Kribbella sandramycini]|uniref:NAD(P)H-binding protein n=1 Tax=Kribbella sandramycini TaxID=60450 RepID=A0A7Y4KXQ3_9ACTN|nr:NmrA family NAD(P)-binding protein [Kribbella sandramycini]MBB6569597.1 uncharacterized protein YbjT (DUF2867 family) [Kribbella sandramycini]NOL40569.1 NAD(P)H-binding protein [Kribbella sandramycini]
MTILVLGATGKTGRRVVERLRARGVDVRAASRSSEVRFDWTDSSTWADAVRDVEAMYLVAPEDPAVIEPFVTASGVRRIVLLSGRRMDAAAGRFGGGMVEAERVVRSSGAEWTILRANNFAQNFDEDLWHEPVLSGRLALPADAVGEPFIDVEDLADVAAAVLTSAGHGGQVYELSGPESLTFAEAVATIAKVSGRSVDYVPLTPAAYEAELLAAGWPREAADELNGLFAIMAEGHLAEPTDEVARLLGRPATTFAEYAERVWAG